MSTFKPSDVFLYFQDSLLQSGAQEIMVAQIVHFLSKNGDDWEKVIEWEALEESMDTAVLRHPLYNRPHKNPVFARVIGDAIHALIENQYLEWVKVGNQSK